MCETATAKTKLSLKLKQTKDDGATTMDQPPLCYCLQAKLTLTTEPAI